MKNINLSQLITALLSAGTAIFNARAERRNRPTDAPARTSAEKVAATAGVVATVAGIVAAALTPGATADSTPAPELASTATPGAAN